MEGDLNKFITTMHKDLDEYTKSEEMVRNVTKKHLVELYKKQDGRCYFTNRQMRHTVFTKTYDIFSDLQFDSDDVCYGMCVDVFDIDKGYVMDNIYLTCVIIKHMRYLNNPLLTKGNSAGSVVI